MPAASPGRHRATRRIVSSSRLRRRLLEPALILGRERALVVAVEHGENELLLGVVQPDDRVGQGRAGRDRGRGSRLRSTRAREVISGEEHRRSEENELHFRFLSGGWGLGDRGGEPAGAAGARYRPTRLRGRVVPAHPVADRAERRGARRVRRGGWARTRTAHPLPNWNGRGTGSDGRWRWMAPALCRTNLQRREGTRRVHSWRGLPTLSSMKLAPVLWLLVFTALERLPRAQGSLTERYRDPAQRIVGAALLDRDGYAKLTHLTTRIGNRLSGSGGLERAIEWASGAMKAEGLTTRTQPVMVPHWVRGSESLEVTSPVPRTLGMLGLGMSVGTPSEGITAPVVVVRDFDELERLGRAAVEGKIVVYAVEWAGYGKTVQYRASGASRAAALGARAALVRSAGGASLYTPHTGTLSYADDQPRIPAAAITPEDAAWFLRMREAGETVTVKLSMEAKQLPDAPSANVIAEIRGRELPGEVVVMGGHFDSWDVGQGAHDDGAACMAAWEALTLLHRLGLQPRRTLRVVLWTNEENGTAGGKAYRAALGDDVSSHVAAIEMDGGCERPVGFGFSLPGAKEDGPDERYERGYRMLTEIGALFETLGASAVARHGHGTDIEPLMNDGVPGLSLDTVGEHYFDWHHTNGDTLDKVDPHDFRKAVALLGVMGYVLADMPETLAGSQGQVRASTAARDD